MGIRIEDSIAVQEEHPFVLTTEAVKEVCSCFPFAWLELGVGANLVGVGC